MPGLVGSMLDSYHLVEQIGKGGMATVYRAVETKRLSEVALKVLSPTIGGERRFLKRFRREAEFVKQRLKHPNIVQVIDYGEYQGYVYLVMPFVRGETLQDRLARGNVLQAECKRWVGQVSSALAFAHSKGIIHRDIKPSNVLISESGDALLTDFGLAREVEGSNTLTGSMLMGTPAFVSPEQGRGEKLDPRSDQYSFGVILYLMATGRLPFQSTTPMATVLQHIQEPVPKPSRFNFDIPPALETVILKSLAKKRDDRFEDMKTLNEAYQAAISGRPLPWLKVPPQTPSREEAKRDEALYPLFVPEYKPRQRRAFRWFFLIGILLLLSMGTLLISDLSEWGFPWSSSPPNNPIPAATSATVVINVSPTENVPASAPSPTQGPPVTSKDCPGIVIYPPAVEGGDVIWRVLNDTPMPVGILEIPDISWSMTATSGKLERIRIGDEVIAEGEDLEGELRLEGLIGILENGRTTSIQFEFPGPAGKTGYAFSLVLDAGCTLSGSW
jgi:serine/threonine protein kinase